MSARTRLAPTLPGETWPHTTIRYEDEDGQHTHTHWAGPYQRKPVTCPACLRYLARKAVAHSPEDRP